MLVTKLLRAKRLKLKRGFTYFRFKTFLKALDPVRRTRWVGGGALGILSAPSLPSKPVGEDARGERKKKTEPAIKRLKRPLLGGPGPEAPPPAPLSVPPTSVPQQLAADGPLSAAVGGRFPLRASPGTLALREGVGFSRWSLRQSLGSRQRAREAWGLA